MGALSRSDERRRRHRQGWRPGAAVAQRAAPARWTSRAGGWRARRIRPAGEAAAAVRCLPLHRRLARLSCACNSMCEQSRSALTGNRFKLIQNLALPALGWFSFHKGIIAAIQRFTQQKSLRTVNLAEEKFFLEFCPYLLRLALQASVVIRSPSNALCKTTRKVPDGVFHNLWCIAPSETQE